MEDLWLMTTAHIAKFSGGEIHITGNIVGTLEDNMIPNRLDV